MKINNSTSFVRESRYVQLNSEDYYEISNTGAIKAIKTNESILSGKDSTKSKRPQSGRFNNKRPWSNRSYKRTASGSVGSRPSSSKTKIFCVAQSHSVNSRKSSLNSKHKSHLSKVDQIIGQTSVYQNPKPSRAKMPRKYNKLRSQKSIDSKMAGVQKSLNPNNPHRNSFRSSL